jgi:hypothetical protein
MHAQKKKERRMHALQYMCAAKWVLVPELSNVRACTFGRLATHVRLNVGILLACHYFYIRGSFVSGKKRRGAVTQREKKRRKKSESKNQERRVTEKEDCIRQSKKKGDISLSHTLSLSLSFSLSP